MKVLEEIFGSILIFARHLRTETPDRTEIDELIADTYDKFKKKLKVFMSVCRGPGGSNNYHIDHGRGAFDLEDASEEMGAHTNPLPLSLARYTHPNFPLPEGFPISNMPRW